MTTKMVFHGSDIEKICDYYYINHKVIFDYLFKSSYMPV